MRRRAFFALPALAACGRRRPPPFTMPGTLAGGWRLRGMRRDGRKTFGSYEGPGQVEVEVDDTGSFAAALDRQQRAHAEPNAVFFSQGPYFATVRWQQADRAALHALVKELENRLK